MDEWQRRKIRNQKSSQRIVVELQLEPWDSKQRLTVTKGRNKAVFEIGNDGDKWVRKILDPLSRMDKLGVKPGMACWLSRGFGKDFQAELKQHGGKVTRQIGKCELAFFFIRHRDQLGDLFEVCESLPDKTNIWTVYPKGHDAITQSDVMNALKKPGFGPGKTATFDEGVSSMRYARKK